MSIKKILLFVIILCTVQSVAHAKDPFKLSLVVNRGGRYVAPFDKKIAIYSQPTPFSVRLINVSDSAQMIYKLANASAIQGLQFEIKEPGRSKEIVKMKKEHLRSSTVIGRHIKPGERRVARIVIDPDTWDNIVILKPNVEYTVRAVYRSGSTKIYSDYYTVVLEE
jgi:hypothetical protein